jgi:ADP-ribosylglycohydrolase
MTSSVDRIVGAIVGGAIGDALGGVEERRRVGISDDTQLTLATCEAIDARGNVDPAVVASSFLAWFRTGRLSGLGSATVKALRDLSAGAHWALAGARGEMAAGNGPAMRIAPLAFVLDPFNPVSRVVVRDVCRITHHSDEAYIGALAVLLAIHSVHWPPGTSLFSDIATALPDSRVRDGILAYSQLPSDISITGAIERFGSSGYVVETVPLSLLLAGRLTPASFSTLLAELVRAGDDADTIGAIAGQIAGSHLGFSHLPAELVSIPAVAEVIPQAQAFARKISGAA